MLRLTLDAHRSREVLARAGLLAAASVGVQPRLHDAASSVKTGGFLAHIPREGRSTLFLPNGAAVTTDTRSLMSQIALAGMPARRRYRVELPNLLNQNFKLELTKDRVLRLYVPRVGLEVFSSFDLENRELLSKIAIAILKKPKAVAQEYLRMLNDMGISNFQIGSAIAATAK